MNFLKRLWIPAVILLLLNASLFAQEGGPYKFTDVKRLPATSIKNQYRSGTCWSYSGCSFFESELIRMGKPEISLSPMFIVRNIYNEKAVKYVRMDGTIQFAVGGEFWDVAHTIRTQGITPMEVYPGLNYGTDKPVFGELDAVLKGYVDAVVANKNKKITTAWNDGFNGILDAYFGKDPESFQYNGKTYTPKSFAEMLGLNMDDYVFISSYTHHPFYQPFQIEISDNWAWGSVYNVPLDEMMKIIDNSLDKGYTIAWASDVSEKGFQWKKGFAVIPAESDVNLDSITAPVKEMNITQELRQVAFDDQTTTDDHGMHIVGYAADQNGDRFYIVKNSWGTILSPYNGYLYVSVPFVRYKTTNIMVNKNAVPSDLRKKLGF